MDDNGMGGAFDFSAEDELFYERLKRELFSAPRELDDSELDIVSAAGDIGAQSGAPDALGRKKTDFSGDM